MDDEKVVNWAVETAGRAAPGIIFVKRKDRAKSLAEAIEQRLGGAAVWVTSEVPEGDRRGYIERMRSGELKVAVATSAWSTGVDIPELRWIAYADKGRAPIWVEQAGARGSRIAEGKDSFDLYDIACEDSHERAEHISGYTMDDVLENGQQRKAGRQRGSSFGGQREDRQQRQRSEDGEELIYTPWWCSPRFWGEIIMVWAVTLYVTC